MKTHGKITTTTTTKPLIKAFGFSNIVFVTNGIGVSEERIESKTVICLLSVCVSTDVCLSALLVIRAHINLSGGTNDSCVLSR